ncbi:hypothetical protein LINGRAHAP2_LOCUS26084 [Linum grandiflorum]
MADPKRFGDNLRNSPSPLGSPLEGLLSCLSTSSSSSDSNAGFPVSSPILILTPPDSSLSEEENQAEGDATEATPGTSGVNQPEKLVTGDCTERDSPGAVDLRPETKLPSKARVGSQAKGSPMKELKIGKKNVAPEGKSVDGSKPATATVENLQASGSEPARIRVRSLEESRSPVTEEAQICQKNMVSAAVAEASIVSIKVCAASFSSPSAQTRTRTLKSLEKPCSYTEQILIPETINKAKSIEGLKSGAPAIGITNVSPQDHETDEAARIQMEESDSRVREEQLCQANVVVEAAVQTNTVFMKACKASFSSSSARTRKPDSPAEEAPGILKKKISCTELVVTEVEDSVADIPVDSTGGQGEANVSTKRKLELCASLATNRAGKRSCDELGRRKICPKVALLLKVLKICAKDDECLPPKPETSTSLVEIAKMRGMKFP